MVRLLDLHTCGQSDVTSAERSEVFGDLRLRCFLQSRWCVVLSFVSLSLSPSFSVLEFLVCRCHLPSFDLALLSRNLSFIAFISSEQINWVFFGVFYHEGHGLAKKLLLIIFIFWQISSTFRYALILWTEAPFSILKKVPAPITSGECSCGH